MFARRKRKAATPASRAAYSEGAPVLEAVHDLAARPAAESPIDLREVLAQLVEGAVWTARNGAWQEHASFLLTTEGNRWYHLPFTDPAVADLVAGPGELPGSDSCALLDLSVSGTGAW